MSHRLQINITREVLEASKMCGRDHNSISKDSGVGSNCAISKAICSIFPDAWVYHNFIDFKAFSGGRLIKRPVTKNFMECSDLPKEARIFIAQFDDLNSEERAEMEPISFEIEIPDSIIDEIGISEVEKILSNCTTMELVN